MPSSGFTSPGGGGRGSIAGRGGGTSPSTCVQLTSIGFMSPGGGGTSAG
eukprot:CAMPEP_0204062984 /NCGR_PEP_ID=MMETSP0360-20130528/145447_1 /ASSEMBLY_ACC=CAM_ASM_000342 /TAXON_ID=268821 /ORGANISM="Scrippsiella Hangoei, Strain SHTV-5" /LENGTH=48 /DNA_ID= /DNA_START= /DNA_END= /DNA_ORIENTATION=